MAVTNDRKGAIRFGIAEDICTVGKDQRNRLIHSFLVGQECQRLRIVVGGHCQQLGGGWRPSCSEEGIKSPQVVTCPTVGGVPEVVPQVGDLSCHTGGVGGDPSLGVVSSFGSLRFRKVWND